MKAGALEALTQVSQTLKHLVNKVGGAKRKLRKRRSRKRRRGSKKRGVRANQNADVNQNTDVKVVKRNPGAAEDVNFIIYFFL